MESEKVNAMGNVAIKNVAMKKCRHWKCRREKNCFVSTSGDKKISKG